MTEENKAQEVEPKQEMDVLRAATINTVFAMLTYYNKNKNHISKNEMFKVLVAASIFPMDVEFPPEAKSLLLDPQNCSEESKNFMAFATHLFDINTNVRLRQITKEVEKTVFEEEKK